jgi:hypothetical protein
LKANYYVGGDGSKQFAYFTDSTLSNTPCSFATAADGSTRCLPNSGANVTLFYSDAACTSPLGSGTLCSTPPAYATSFTPGMVCDQNLEHVYPITGAFTGAMIYQGGEGGSCTATPTPTTVGFYAVGAEVPATNFQQATIQAE